MRIIRYNSPSIRPAGFLPATKSAVGGVFGVAQVKRIMISLPESLLAEVDIIVREEGKNRSEFIREAMRTYISEQHRRQLRERMRAGYEAMGEVNLSMAEEALAVDNDCLIRYEEALSEVEGA